MWRCSEEMKNRVLQLETINKKEAKHYIGVVASQFFFILWLWTCQYFELYHGISSFLYRLASSMQDNIFSLAPLWVLQLGFKTEML